MLGCFMICRTGCVQCVMICRTDCVQCVDDMEDWLCPVYWWYAGLVVSSVWWHAGLVVSSVLMICRTGCVQYVDDMLNWLRPVCDHWWYAWTGCVQCVDGMQDCLCADALWWCCVYLRTAVMMAEYGRNLSISGEHVVVDTSIIPSPYYRTFFFRDAS